MPTHHPTFVNGAAEWSRQLGLLPVPLFSTGAMDRTVLLNGNAGNFCLDVSPEITEDDRATAWSANVGHYVRLRQTHVEIQRWTNSFSERERYSLDSVTRDLERFHSYLASNEPPPHRAVVSHLVRTFRQIRNRKELKTGADSLRVLLLLLACAATNQGRSQINAASWAIPDSAKQLADSIYDAEWEALVSGLLNPTDIDLKLDVELMIRHAAGPVFQEAHREAFLIDEGQIPLPGFTRRAATIRHADIGVGVHFTPPPLARSVVEQALNAWIPTDAVTVFDPACGSAEFLREALRQLRLRGFSGRVNLTGFDISTTACEMARFLLHREQQKDNKLDFSIIQADSLLRTWPKDVNVLLMNPPFVSYEQLTPAQKSAVTEVMGSLARGRIEYSNAFLYKATTSLSSDSVIGAIIPSSFFESESATHLRDEIRMRVSPWLIARLGSQVLFPDAIVDAGLIVAKMNGGSSDNLLAFWADHRNESTAEGLRYLRKTETRAVARSSVLVDREGFSIYHADDLIAPGKPWAPRRYSAWTFAKRLSGIPRAGYLFNIHTGARSGLLKAFLLPKEQWLQLPRKEQRFFRPAVVNESVIDGRLNDSVYVFYPHGQFAFDSERALRTILPNFYKNHLANYRDSLRTRESGAVNENWWEMHRPRGWQLVRAPKLVSVQYGDVGAFGWDDSGEFVVVGGYAWLPRPPLKHTVFSAKLGLAYLAILNSPIFFELVGSNSRKVRGGQWDLGNKYLTNVPLPNLARSSNSQLISSLFEYGSALNVGKAVDWSALDKAVLKVYGL